MMTDKPIIFSAPMVQALLDGRKTQTRRMLKGVPEQPAAKCHPHHISKHSAPYLDAYCGEKTTSENPRGMSTMWNWWQVDDRMCWPQFKVPYAPCYRLWVRESVSAYYFGENYVHYWADGAKILAVDHEKWDALDRYAYMRNPDNQSEWGARLPSIHMPRWASRLTLTVTDVRVQRLQDISEADAVAEGVSPHAEGWAVGGKFWGPTPQAAFRFLWEDIHGAESWDENPWIVALIFTVQHGNIDKIEGPRK